MFDLSFLSLDTTFMPTAQWTSADKSVPPTACHNVCASAETHAAFILVSLSLTVTG